VALPLGARLGQYEIVSALGAGGMGEVYRARDTKLDRDVALKLLPPALVSDPGRLRRFELEARAIAGLNHPAIVAIYEFGQFGSQPFISMELVDGMTLREILEAGALPPRRALQVAAPIADGLAKAHDAGIVHRDLKPENLMLSHDGFGKILDFGLARLVADPDPRAGGHPLETTITTDGTNPGTTMGTVGYMSPEQASGSVADHRSDQFAFGLVLYEMLAGRPAFNRATPVETLAAIIRDEPPSLREGNPAIPVPVLWIVDRCLAKDPFDRYASTRDLARDLATARDHFSQLTASGAAAVPPASGKRARRRELVAWALVATLLAAGLALVFRVMSRPATDLAAPVRFTLSPPKDVHFSWSIGTSPFAVSPNGRQLAFTATGPDNRRRLWLHSFDSIESRPMAGTEGAFGAFWSPDGRAIGFFTPDRLKRVSVAGGDVAVICDAQFGGGATWNRDGVIVFAPRIDTPLYRVAATGGTPVPVTTLDALRGEGAHMKPLFLPDGRHFLFVAVGGEASGSYVASLDSAERTRVSAETFMGFTTPDVLFFPRDRTLMAQRIDLESFTLLGQPTRVAESVDRLGPSAAFAVSDSATLVYWQGSRVITQPTWFHRNGTTAGTLGPAAAYVNVALSHDGEQAAADRFDLTPGIWLFHRARNTPIRATFGGVYESTPVWSPDGAAFVFAAARDTPPNLYVKRMRVPGDEERLFRDPFQMFPQSWSSDGRFIAYVTIHPKTGGDIWLFPTSGDRTPAPFLQTEFAERHARISPDGRWMAYSSDESGSDGVYVTRFPQAGAKWSVSPKGGAFPIWRRDGRELFYRAPGGQLMAVPIAAGAEFQPGVAVPLFNPAAAVNNLGLGTFYDVAPDGRFLINVFVERTSPPATVVLNWRPDAEHPER
jgi:serine/threonine protein kinase/Tol biopolymer transport system component